MSHDDDRINQIECKSKNKRKKFNDMKDYKRNTRYSWR